MTSPNPNKYLPLLSFLFALFLQTIVVVSYFAEIAGDLKTAIRDIERNTDRIDRLELTVQKQEVTLARMSEHLGAIRKVVESMDERARSRD